MPINCFDCAYRTSGSRPGAPQAHNTVAVGRKVDKGTIESKVRNGKKRDEPES